MLYKLFWATFLCFLSGCLGSLVLANASSCLELRFARVSVPEEPLALRCEAGGKPSTMVTAGKLVEHSLLAATLFSPTLAS